VDGDRVAAIAARRNAFSSSPGGACGRGDFRPHRQRAKPRRRVDFREVRPSFSRSITRRRLGGHSAVEGRDERTQYARMRSLALREPCARKRRHASHLPVEAKLRKFEVTASRISAAQFGRRTARKRTTLVHVGGRPCPRVKDHTKPISAPVGARSLSPFVCYMIGACYWKAKSLSPSARERPKS